MHTPWIFSKLWSWVKDYIPERTQAKVKIHLTPIRRPSATILPACKVKIVKSGKEHLIHDDVSAVSRTKSLDAYQGARRGVTRMSGCCLPDSLGCRVGLAHSMVAKCGMVAGEYRYRT